MRRTCCQTSLPRLASGPALIDVLCTYLYISHSYTYHWMFCFDPVFSSVKPLLLYLLQDSSARIISQSVRTRNREKTQCPASNIFESPFHLVFNLNVSSDMYKRVRIYLQTTTFSLFSKFLLILLIFGDEYSIES